MGLVQVLVVLSCLTSVLGDVVDSWTQPPHHAPIYPPVGAPHHHKGGGHHHKAPTHPPVRPPVHPPVRLPIHPPAHSPRHPPVQAPSHSPAPTRKLVAVQGVVFCKPCKYFGIDTLLGATPLLGATVRLECKNTKYKAFKQEAKTDKNGYFFIMAPKTITTYASHKCKVYLVSAPKSAKCKKPTNLHYGLKGAILMPSKPTLPPPPPSLHVFTVGPFAFEPSTKLPCSH
ncbi:hypothetical protein LguiB_004973 [Lonicera macranthoides]